MDKTYDVVIKPLKNEGPPPGNHGKHIFLLETVIVTTKIVNSKSLRKICRQLLSTMNVFQTMTASNASRDTLNNSNLFAFLCKCDTMRLFK